MSTDTETRRSELKGEGRSMVEIAATMLALGAVIGVTPPIVMLTPIAPDIAVAQSAVVGMGSGLLAGIALVVVYRLVEGRLVDKYLETVGDENRGEAA